MFDTGLSAPRWPVLVGRAYSVSVTMLYAIDQIPVPKSEWSTTLVGGAAVGPDAWVGAATALVAYVRELVTTKRAHPADDLMSALVAARDGADRLTEDELTSMVFLLLVAGHETTVNLIGNGMYTLLTHPERRALLQAEPECLPAAVEELLRFDGPVQVATFRPTKWYQLFKVYHRSHIRVAVMDGTVGYTGGYGIDDKWYGDGRHKDQWRDTTVRFTGPAVLQLQATFAAGRTIMGSGAGLGTRNSGRPWWPTA